MYLPAVSEGSTFAGGANTRTSLGSLPEGSQPGTRRGTGDKSSHVGGRPKPPAPASLPSRGRSKDRCNLQLCQPLVFLAPCALPATTALRSPLAEFVSTAGGGGQGASGHGRARKERGARKVEERARLSVERHGGSRPEGCAWPRGGTGRGGDKLGGHAAGWHHFRCQMNNRMPAAWRPQVGLACRGCLFRQCQRVYLTTRTDRTRALGDTERGGNRRYGDTVTRFVLSSLGCDQRESRNAVTL